MEAVPEGTRYSVRFMLRGPAQDVLLALLLDYGFEGFEQQQDALIGFVPHADWIRFRGAVVQMTAPRGSVPCTWEATSIAPRNWNAEWESSIRPVEAGPFLIHPPWFLPPDGKRAICIEPKMSFGTGHHETTRLVLTLLSPIIRSGDRVLDAGTGTGVLAIAAVQLGAAAVDAFDIDTWSVENGRENTARNGISDRVRFTTGGLETTPAILYDAILANINRNVLLSMLGDFRERLKPSGHLVLSGVLQTDRSVMQSALDREGFRVSDEATEGEWLALVAKPV